MIFKVGKPLGFQRVPLELFSRKSKRKARRFEYAPSTFNSSVLSALQLSGMDLPDVLLSLRKHL
jgi:hypothetical protein